ncbi:MAG TPA: hypothetical protein VIW24_05540 [Aldersonia sp.]
MVTAAASAAFIAFGVPASAQPGSADILPPGFPCIHTNVYPLPLLEWGWGPIDGAAPRYAADTGPSGAGYLDMYTPPDGVTNYFHPGINTPLSTLLGANSLGFLHRGATAFQLRIRGADRPDDLSGFTTLVWEPAYNNNEGAENWFLSGDLARGNWWSTRDIGGQSAGATTANLRRLDQISNSNPRAFVTEYGVSVGRTSVASQGAADDITYGCARWDFEPAPSGSG